MTKAYTRKFATLSRDRIGTHIKLDMGCGHRILGEVIEYNDMDGSHIAVKLPNGGIFRGVFTIVIEPKSKSEKKMVASKLKELRDLEEKAKKLNSNIQKVMDKIYKIRFEL